MFLLYRIDSNLSCNLNAYLGHIRKISLKFIKILVPHTFCDSLILKTLKLCQILVEFLQVHLWYETFLTLDLTHYASRKLRKAPQFKKVKNSSILSLEPSFPAHTALFYQLVKVPWPTRDGQSGRKCKGNQPTGQNNTPEFCRDPHPRIKLITFTQPAPHMTFTLHPED